MTCQWIGQVNVKCLDILPEGGQITSAGVSFFNIESDPQNIDIKQVSFSSSGAGDSVLFALKSNGDLYVISDAGNPLRSGTTVEDISSLTLIQTGIRQVTSNEFYSVIVTNSGDVKFAGDINSGEGGGTPGFNVTGANVDYAYAAILIDFVDIFPCTANVTGGQIINAGYPQGGGASSVLNSSFSPNNINFAEVGGVQTLSLTSDGELWGFAYTNYGTGFVSNFGLGIVDPNDSSASYYSNDYILLLSNIVAASASSERSFAVTNNGELFFTGSSYSGIPLISETVNTLLWTSVGTGFTNIFTGRLETNTVAIKDDGFAYILGSDFTGQFTKIPNSQGTKSASISGTGIFLLN